jgi:hypothetical protein
MHPRTATLDPAPAQALLREHMRTSDRALSNIEALPEGFNALRRLHEQIQEPLMNAAMAPESTSGTGGTAGSGAAGGDPLAALLQQALGGVAAAGGPGNGAANAASGGAAGAGASPNAAPLPNPWAPGERGGSCTAYSSRPRRERLLWDLVFGSVVRVRVAFCFASPATLLLLWRCALATWQSYS